MYCMWEVNIVTGCEWEPYGRYTITESPSYTVPWDVCFEPAVHVFSS